MDKTGFYHRRVYYGTVYGGGNSGITYVDAATNLLSVFNMSATMVRHGSWLQLQQSDMHLAIDMAIMAKGGTSCCVI